MTMKTNVMIVMIALLVLLSVFETSNNMRVEAWNASSPSSRTESRRSWIVSTIKAATATSLLTSSTFTSTAAATETTNEVVKVGGKIRYGTEDIMKPKAHGTSDKPVQTNLMYGVSNQLADKICNYNRHFAENAGYFTRTNWSDVVLASSTTGKPVTFYDSVTGVPLFVAPIGRSPEELLKESEVHGWPSFRDSEVVWDNVRILPNGETVSVTGTHLGHNLPDRKGNRYCINLVSIAGQPLTAASTASTSQSTSDSSLKS